MASLGLDLLIAGELEESVRLLSGAMNGLADSLGRARPNTRAAAPNRSIAPRRRRQHYAAKYRPGHPGALLSTMTLAAARSASAAHQHDAEQAVRSARDALAGLESLYGPDHPSTLACANNTAVYELRAGTPGEARVLLERANVGLAERLGHDNPHSRAASHNLAIAARAPGRRRDVGGLGTLGVECSLLVGAALRVARIRLPTRPPVT